MKFEMKWRKLNLPEDFSPFGIKNLNKMAKKLNKFFQKLKVTEESTAYNFQTCVQKTSLQ